MPGTRCVNCRWWTGNKQWAIAAFNETERHGKCHRIVASTALPADMQARLYPVGTQVWLNTRFDFTCSLWEKQP